MLAVEQVLDNQLLGAAESVVAKHISQDLLRRSLTFVVHSLPGKSQLAGCWRNQLAPQIAKTLIKGGARYATCMARPVCADS